MENCCLWDGFRLEKFTESCSHPMDSVIFSLPCPAVEKSDTEALVASWHLVRVTPLSYCVSEEKKHNCCEVLYNPYKCRVWKERSRKSVKLESKEITAVDSIEIKLLLLESLFHLQQLLEPMTCHFLPDISSSHCERRVLAPVLCPSIKLFGLTKVSSE